MTGLAAMTASAFRKAAGSVMRFAVSAVQTAANVFFDSKDTLDTVYDTDGIISLEIPSEEKFMCLPCSDPENEPIAQVASVATDCCVPTLLTNECTTHDLQGAALSSGVRQLTNLCARSAVIAGCDSENSMPSDGVCCVSESYLSTVVEESLHHELEARDSCCLTVEVQCEPQTVTDMNVRGAACGSYHTTDLPAFLIPGLKGKCLLERFRGLQWHSADDDDSNNLRVEGIREPGGENSHMCPYRDCGCPAQPDNRRLNSTSASRWGRLVMLVLLLWVDCSARACKVNVPKTSNTEATLWSNLVRCKTPEHENSDLPNVTHVDVNNSRVSGKVTQSVCDENKLSSYPPRTPDTANCMVSATSTLVSDEGLLQMSHKEGDLWLPDSEEADHISLWSRVATALPGTDEPPPTRPGTSCSNDWFNGKMQRSWFDTHLVQIDHSDDRFRRDWSLKASEIPKGPNRFAKQWRQYVAIFLKGDLDPPTNSKMGLKTPRNREFVGSKALIFKDEYFRSVRNFS